MSGVFPGTRTMLFQRVRLRPLAAVDAASPGDVAADAEAAGALRWARLLWYSDPAALVVMLDGGAGQTSPEQGELLLRLAEPHAGDLLVRLAAALAAAGWRLQSCGGCRWWQRVAVEEAEGMPQGQCTDAAGALPVLPDALAIQSMTALACGRFAAVVDVTPAAAAVAPVTMKPVTKRAERESDERWSWLRQSWHWARRRLLPPAAGDGAAPAAPHGGDPLAAWEERLMERSGVGAGTEPCFACQGRLANLGALAVASPEGDKQTYSVWRCRHCYTWYLNDWVDRWERLDSLETEERWYRLSPAAALEALAVIDNVVHAEHPARRHERGAQRAWMVAFVQGHPLLSHQIRLGR
jgi:hypothetical protein